MYVRVPARVHAVHGCMHGCIHGRSACSLVRSYRSQRPHSSVLLASRLAGLAISLLHVVLQCSCFASYVLLAASQPSSWPQGPLCRWWAVRVGSVRATCNLLLQVPQVVYLRTACRPPAPRPHNGRTVRRPLPSTPGRHGYTGAVSSSVARRPRPAGPRPPRGPTRRGPRAGSSPGV